MNLFGPSHDIHKTGRDLMDRPSDGTEALERAWIARIVHQDRAAFEALYKRFERPLFRYLTSLLRSPELAEEILDDVMVEIWHRASRFSGSSRPSTWIFAIAHHKAIDRLRRRKVSTLTLDDLSHLAGDTGAPDEAALHESFRREVALALAELSPDHRSVIELAFGFGYAYCEIAEIVNCPVNTVKTRMHHARKQLQVILERRGLGREHS
jgi:RNA polymerase sigma-70 factor (ECF subfamily)